jgi:hypothetical protein
MQSSALLESSRLEESVEPPLEAPRWGPMKRGLFRFAFSYLVLYLLPFPLNVFWPSLQWYENLWNAVVPWVGRHVFETDVNVLPNGSGDTTYNYIQVFCFLVLALAAALVWTLLDRRRAHYRTLHEWLRVYVRFGLAVAMISYAAVKIIKSQFPDPSFDRLLQPFGDSSPMGLLWTFMGASVSYNVFTGLGELAGGLLLTARRTTLLGALVCIAVLANVVMLNFSYDVPVKLYSSHLLAMAVFLTLPDLRRLGDFFLFHRALEPMEVGRLVRRNWLHRGVLILRVLFVACVLYVSLSGAWQNYQWYAGRAQSSPLYGIWEVDEFETDGTARPPLATDATRWRRMIFDYRGVLAIQNMDNSRHRYGLELDAARKRLALVKRDDPTWKTSVAFERPAPALLTLRTRFDGHDIRARLHRVENPEFLLTSRGFHWINETPFSR